LRISSKLRDSEAERRLLKALRKDLVDQGVIAKNKVVPYEREQQAMKDAETEATIFEAEEQERQAIDEAALAEGVEAGEEVVIPNRGLDDLRAALRKSLDAIGLKEVGINLSERLEFSGRDADGNMVLGARYDSKQDKFLFKQTPEKRTEAYYQPGINAIFLGLDKISKMDSKGNPLTEEQIRSALADLMNHETVTQCGSWTCLQRRNGSFLRIRREGLNVVITIKRSMRKLKHHIQINL